MSGCVSLKQQDNYAARKISEGGQVEEHAVQRNKGSCQFEGSSST